MRPVIFDRFSEKARRVIFFAHQEAVDLKTGYIGPEHLLLGLIRVARPLFLNLMGENSLTDLAERVRHATRGTYPAQQDQELPMSPEARQAVRLAAQDAEQTHSAQVEPVHLLAGLIREGTSYPAHLLTQRGIGRAQLALAAAAADSPEARDPGLADASLKHLFKDDRCWLVRVPHSRRDLIKSLFEEANQAGWVVHAMHDLDDETYVWLLRPREHRHLG